MMKCLNNKIRKIRLQKNITIKQLANEVGISEKALRMYERGERNPRIGNLVKIANILNVDLLYFYEIDNSINII